MTSNVSLRKFIRNMVRFNCENLLEDNGSDNCPTIIEIPIGTLGYIKWAISAPKSELRKEFDIYRKAKGNQTLINELIRFGYNEADFELSEEIKEGIKIKHRTRGGEFVREMNNLTKEELLDAHREFKHEKACYHYHFTGEVVPAYSL